ncbi:hypothetical protein PFISCL1PPCAC_12038, partial [Pristionchus fissidentatus]
HLFSPLFILHSSLQLHSTMRLPLFVAALLLVTAVRSYSTANENLSEEEKALARTYLDAVPNFFYYLVVENFLTEVPPTFVTALKNGILCEADDATALTKLKGGETASDDQVKHSEKALGANCASPTSKIDTCVCTARNPHGWCNLLRNAEKFLAEPGFVRKPCPELALATLKTKGHHELGKQYDFQAMRRKQSQADAAWQSAINNHDIGAIDKLTNDAAEEMAKFFCDATDPDVETALKDLVASDGAYLFLDEIVSTLLFGYSTYDEQKKVCAIDAFGKHELGQCMCTHDRGAMFCLVKFIGNWFKKEGFLVCGPAAPAQAAPGGAPIAGAQAAATSFDKTKKPTKMIEFASGKDLLPKTAKLAASTSTLASLVIVALSGLLLLH